ncbi:prostaglandin-F synthase [Aureococcus anophagefferens]|nr:prostaglandin-F synthase [Aureococcus anophagefferens]
MRVSRFALCSLGVATALRPQTSSFARRAARAASTAEDCGCEVTYGGDVPASAKTMDHLAAELLVQLERRRPALEAAGVGLVAVGIGTPEKGRLVADHVGYDASRLLADPENALYDALALNAGAFNQGGMFVFADGASRFVHYDASTGAHADVDAVVDLALSL